MKKILLSAFLLSCAVFAFAASGKIPPEKNKTTEERKGTTRDNPPPDENSPHWDIPDDKPPAPRRKTPPKNNFDQGKNETVEGIIEVDGNTIYIKTKKHGKLRLIVRSSGGSRTKDYFLSKESEIVRVSGIYDRKAATFIVEEDRMPPNDMFPPSRKTPPVFHLF